MNPKKLRKLKKQVKHQFSQPPYLQRMTHYRELFSDFPIVLVLINNVLEADRLLQNKLLPQQLPFLQVPDNFQDQAIQQINAQHPMGDPAGDRLWDQLNAALPKLDQDLRDFRQYLETTYGMWAYISAPFIKDLSDFLAGAPVLEVMAGNGYISQGLRQQNAQQTIFTTDSKDWTQEAHNQTGRRPVTKIEPLDAVSAVEKYGDQVNYLIMAWSPDKLTVDWDLLQAMRAKNKDLTLICIGEKHGATDSQKFWDDAKYLDDSASLEQLNRHFTRFDLMHDQVYLIQ